MIRFDRFTQFVICFMQKPRKTARRLSNAAHNVGFQTRIPAPWRKRDISITLCSALR